MERKNINGVLESIKEYVVLGIYAVEKNNIVEIKRDVLPSKTKLKEEIRKYKAQGYKVYSNG
ncbi:hypothetical protein [Clostridium saudiense]|jgi:hypothetical protein|uniref:hypothetical protein n=1 Tax=Clostridium saudiense TaxID=1414720 RepID=UPI0018AC7A4C|nr:hypothetical protein [Clostridium saudiense]MDU7453081.1 hypothetical protein [Clostridium saudiense]